MGFMSKLAAALAVLSALAVEAQAAKGDAELFTDNPQAKRDFVGSMPPEVHTIVCISPASTPASKLHREGLEKLRSAGYNVKIMPHVFDPPEPGKTGASLESRLADFYAAWLDPEADMILCVRGGWGCKELLENVDWSKLPRRPELYLQGYSDVTQILAAMLAKGYGRPVAGPMSGSMAGLAPECIAEMRAMHHGKKVGPIPVQPLVSGDCQGLSLAGLLSRLVLAAQSDYCPDTAGRVIFIEVVSSSPQKIRDDLRFLLDRGFFAHAKAVVFGHFLRSGEAEEMAKIQREFAPKFGIPVYAGFPFGHSPQCYTIDFRRPVEIKDNAVTFPEVK